MKVSYLRMKREEAGLTQRELAQMLGVDFSVISRIELYKAKLSRKNALKLCELLNIDYEDYLRAITNKEFYTVRYEKVD